MLTGSKPKTPLLFLFICIYLLLSGYVLARFSVASSLGDSCHCARLYDMVEGTAERPYVYRALMPWLIGIVDYMMPVFVQEVAGSALMALQDNEVVRGFINEKTNLQQAFAQPELMHLRASMLLVVALFIAGYVIALYKLGYALFPGENAMALFTPIIGLLMVPALSYPTFYVYDIGVLFLSAACFYCLAASKWRWYYVWFVLACINKETSVFLLLFFTLWFFPRMDGKRFAAHWALQLILFIAIRAVIYQAYAGNPGVFLKNDYMNWQFSILLSGYSYLDFIAYAAAAFILTCGWQEKPLFARYGLFLFAMMAAAFIVFGKPKEYRVFYDTLPLLAVLVTHTLVSCTGIGRAECFRRNAA